MKGGDFMNIHYHVKVDTFGGIIESGESAVCLVFTDVDTDISDCYPIDPDMAIDVANEIIRIANKLKEKEG